MLYYTETVLREICQRNATVTLEKNNIRTNAEERYIFLKAEDEPVQGFCMILFLAYCEVQAIVSSMLRGKWFLTIQIDYILGGVGFGFGKEALVWVIVLLFATYRNTYALIVSFSKQKCKI